MTTTTTTTIDRRTGIAILATVAALPLGLGAIAPADALAPARAKITASVSDDTPASGESFRVSGRLTRAGDGIGGRTVKIQARRDGAWTDLTGAQMSTSSTGGYNLGVVLSQTGQRTLRVKAVLPGRDAHKRFVVTVH